MSLQWSLHRTVPADTAALGQQLFAPTNAYRQLGDRFNELFPEEVVFAPLYDTLGRGAIAPLLVALVIVFQILEKIPDRLAAEMVVSRLDWKYALHLPLAYGGFHWTVLHEFRHRLVEHDAERLVFDQVLEKLQALGLVKARGKVRTDSTHLLGLVARLSQLELVTESLRVAVRAVVAVAPEWSGPALPASFCETYAERTSDYRLGHVAAQQHLRQAGRDGVWLLAQIDRTAPQGVCELSEVAVLRTVLAQQFPEGGDQPPAAKRPMGREVIESPHEPEARCGTKRDQLWRGYKVQVTETCDADTPHLVLDLEPTNALAPDSPELPQIQARLAAQDTLPGEQYVDEGYPSGKRFQESADRGITLMGVPPTGGQAADGFRQTDFQIDAAVEQATCPAGQGSVVWSERHRAPAEPPTIEIRFEGATCQACPFWGRCTKSPQGRSLELHPYHALLAARRAEARTEAFRQKMYVRSGIEGTISELVRAHRMRFARYRGQKKVRVQMLFTAVAANLKRVTRWWARPQKPAAVSTAG
jgi:transposase